MSFQGSVAEWMSENSRGLRLSLNPLSLVQLERNSLLKLANCTDGCITGLALYTCIRAANSVDPTSDLLQSSKSFNKLLLWKVCFNELVKKMIQWICTSSQDPWHHSAPYNMHLNVPIMSYVGTYCYMFIVFFLNYFKRLITCLKWRTWCSFFMNLAALLH